MYCSFLSRNNRDATILRKTPRPKACFYQDDFFCQMSHLTRDSNCRHPSRVSSPAHVCCVQVQYNANQLDSIELRWTEVNWNESNRIELNEWRDYCAPLPQTPHSSLTTRDDATLWINCHDTCLHNRWSQYVVMATGWFECHSVYWTSQYVLIVDIHSRRSGDMLCIVLYFCYRNVTGLLCCRVFLLSMFGGSGESVCSFVHFLCYS